jgi:hypothetical protein
MPGQALPPTCTFLNVGQAFAGTQNVSSSQKDEAWKVNVRLQGCDMQRGYLCGSMEALNVPSAETPVCSCFLSLLDFCSPTCGLFSHFTLHILNADPIIAF